VLAVLVNHPHANMLNLEVPTIGSDPFRAAHFGHCAFSFPAADWGVACSEL
jgi:hypothetical protein